jgi:IS5 family transposase
LAVEELRGQIEHYCDLGDRIIDQARRRVLLGSQFPMPKKSIPSSNLTRI